MENKQPTSQQSQTCEKKLGEYFDEERNVLSRTAWIADLLLGTYLAMNRPSPGPATLATMAEDLACELSDEQLHWGLSRLRKEREWVSVKAIIDLSGATTSDGRPEVETAWAMCPRSEDSSVVWTSEMSDAFGACRPLLNTGDEIGARMVFKEQYTQLLTLSRANHSPVRWTISLGWDATDRVRALLEAIEKKRIAPSHAFSLLGTVQQEQLLSQLPESECRLLRGVENPNTKLLNGFQKTLLDLSDKMEMPKPAPMVERREYTAEEWQELRRIHKAKAEALMKQRAHPAGQHEETEKTSEPDQGA